MGKNKKSTIEIFDNFKNETIVVDSSEEWYFYNWVLEAKQLEIVIEYEYQPESFLLTEKAKYTPAFGKPKEKHLLAEHSYTADFYLKFDKKYGEKLSEFFKIDIDALDGVGNPEVWIDVKAGFNRFGGDRTFSINQKLVYDKHGVFVQKVVPLEMFEKLGAPEAAKLTIKTKKPTLKYAGLKSIKDAFEI